MNKISFEVSHDLPMIEVNIGDKAWVFILDSGASSHFINQNILNENAVNSRPTGIEKSIYTAAGKGGISKEFEVFDCGIGLENVVLRAFSKDFSHFETLLDKPIGGLISLSKLGNGKVYLDVKTNVLYYN